MKDWEFWPVNEEGSLLHSLIKRMSGQPAKRRRKELLEGKIRAAQNCLGKAGSSPVVTAILKAITRSHVLKKGNIQVSHLN